MAAQKRIVVGMSGGVDSAAAAVLLQRAGWDVVGVTCTFVPGDAAAKDAEDARRVCETLGIAHVRADFSGEFETRVVQPFCDAWAAGLTPSPCVSCNACMKLPALAQVADAHGATHIATGHYARVVQLLGNTGEGAGDAAGTGSGEGFGEGTGSGAGAGAGADAPGRFAIKTALDVRKDQSYMLSYVGQDLLSRLVLPPGGMTKTDVRLLAEDLHLPVAHRPESQDLCFAAGGYRELLAAHGISAPPGPICSADGHVLGTHTGLIDYTYGQRQGLGIGGAPEPYFVTGKDATTNTLQVGFAAEARMAGAVVDAPVWQAFLTPPETLECSVKLRYRSRAHACIITPYSAGADGEAPAFSECCESGECGERHAGAIRVTLRAPEALTSPGQFAVFYLGDMVLGGGMISAIIRA